MQPPRLSVILCNYNDAGYLESAIKRLCEGPGVPDQLIVVDDGSTDESLDILDRVQRDNVELEIVRHETNQGIVAAGASGLARATGDFVAWWSVDDRVNPNIFDAVRDAAARYPDVGAIATETDVALETVGGDLAPLYSHRYGVSASGQYISGDDFASLLRQRYVWLGSSGAFIRRDTLVAQGGWREGAGLFADWIAIYMAAFQQGVTLIGTPMSTVVRRENSYGARVRATPGAECRALRNLLDVLREPGNADARAALRRGPLALSYAFGLQLARAGAMRPGDWDLLLAAATRHGWHRLARRLKPGDLDITRLLDRESSG
tara:strand:- start:101072 stop:102031 length:960 start_codon:yes stop_codon:yes gene_type:complete